MSDERRDVTVDEISRLADTPANTISSLDALKDAFSTERWKRNQAAAVRDHRSNSQKTEQQLRPGAIKIVTLGGDTSLREIALAEYGTADSWRLIADYNGIKGSIGEAGTTLIIPPPPVRAGVRQNGNIQAQRPGEAPGTC